MNATPLTHEEEADLRRAYGDDLVTTNHLPREHVMRRVLATLDAERVRAALAADPPCPDCGKPTHATEAAYWQRSADAWMARYLALLGLRSPSGLEETPTP